MPLSRSRLAGRLFPSKSGSVLVGGCIAELSLSKPDFSPKLVGYRHFSIKSGEECRQNRCHGQSAARQPQRLRHFNPSDYHPPRRHRVVSNHAQLSFLSLKMDKVRNAKVARFDSQQKINGLARFTRLGWYLSLYMCFCVLNEINNEE